MFEKTKEMFRESKAVIPLREELKAVMPDSEKRQQLNQRFRQISQSVECPHNESHILTFVIEMLKYTQNNPDFKGAFLEAGCFKGGSTAKLSLVADYLDRDLHVYDSFEGIPDNEEDHKRSIFGYSIKNWFYQGSFSGGIDEVRTNVERHGVISRCTFTKGWFENTLPQLEHDIAGAYIDVDLASSTRDCIKYIYPRLLPGGFLVSQDGDFPLVIDVFDDDQLWEQELGCKKPTIHGLRTSKMLVVYKQ
jgi:O-methyltransferase